MKKVVSAEEKIHLCEWWIIQTRMCYHWSPKSSSLNSDLWSLLLAQFKHHKVLYISPHSEIQPIRPPVSARWYIHLWCLVFNIQPSKCNFDQSSKTQKQPKVFWTKSQRSLSNICDMILCPLFGCQWCIVWSPIVQPRWIHCRSHALLRFSWHIPAESITQRRLLLQIPFWGVWCKS